MAGSSHIAKITRVLCKVTTPPVLRTGYIVYVLNSLTKQAVCLSYASEHLGLCFQLQQRDMFQLNATECTRMYIAFSDASLYGNWNMFSMQVPVSLPPQATETKGCVSKHIVTW
jgi:hypothetical protein